MKSIQSIKKIDILFCCSLLLFWTLPHFYSNLTLKKVPFTPDIANYFYRTSNLFTHANYIWPVPYIQVKLSPDDEWTTLDEQDYFSMPTFGHRTKIFEALYLARTEVAGHHDISWDVRVQLAEWVARRYQQKHNQHRKPSYVRFVAGLYRVKSDTVSTGRWRVPPIKEFDSDDFYVLSEHEIKN